MKKNGLLWSIQKAWLFRPGYLVISVLQAVLSGFLPVVSAILMQKLLNLIQTKEFNFQKCLVLVIFLIMSEAFGTYVTAILTVKLQNFETKFDTFIQNEILEKAGRLDCKNFEDSGTYDLINRIQNDIHAGVEGNIQAFISMFASGIGLLSYGIIIGSYHLWILLLLTFSYFFRLVVEKKYRLKEYNALRENTENFRRTNYLAWLLLHPEYIKEIKTFRVFQKLLDRFRNLRKVYDDTLIGIRNRKLSCYLWLELVEGFVDVLVTIYLIYETYYGFILIGSFILYNNAIESLKQNLLRILEKNAEVATNAVVVEQLKSYYDLPDESNQEKEGDFVKIDSLELRHVFYRYQGKSEYVLQNINILIRGGDKIVLTGPNGSGKSTLAKIILGIYNDYEGEILVNGIERKQLSIEQYRQHMSALFQDYIKYETTVRDNLFLGEKNFDEELSENLLQLAEMVDFKDTLDEPLGYRFQDGRELSIGQWQKMAFLRALIKSSSVRLLDEPNAALDIIVEDRLFSYFDQTRGKHLDIIIIHRFHKILESASEVVVLEKGRICSRGSHQKVFAENEFYQSLCRAGRAREL